MCIRDRRHEVLAMPRATMQLITDQLRFFVREQTILERSVQSTFCLVSH